MKIIFDNNIDIEWQWIDSPVTANMKKALKHLQHVEIPFCPWYDNPFERIKPNRQELENSAKLLGIDIDNTKLNLQSYLNYLHTIYETQTDHSMPWMNFHGQIHRREEQIDKFLPVQTMIIDWRKAGGHLKFPFENTWIEHTINTLEPGDIFVEWSELGKTPYRYWRDGEPDNLDRMCELALPWIDVQPKMCIALEHIQMIPQRHVKSFEFWWSTRKQHWCKHWNLPNWTMENMFCAIKYAKINNVDMLIQFAQQNISPKKVTLG